MQRQLQLPPQHIQELLFRSLERKKAAHQKLKTNQKKQAKQQGEGLLIETKTSWPACFHLLLCKRQQVLKAPLPIRRLLKLKKAKKLEKQVDKDKYERDFTLGACEQLKQKLGLKKVPHKIEGYDISNISGTNKVASMVVFIDGTPRKNLYRKFIIKSVEGSNDFASMLETLNRRFENVTTTKDESFNNLPDLIVIDGGKGQLSSAYYAMQKYGFDVEMIGLAKKEEEVFKVGASDSIILDRASYALRLLQRVRDESHRFAITFHRYKRQKITSVLQNLDKIGAKTARNLMLHFKSLDNIANASLEELEKVVRKDQAQAIFDAYHK